MVTGENFPEEARYKYKTHRTKAIDLTLKNPDYVHTMMAGAIEMLAAGIVLSIASMAELTVPEPHTQQIFRCAERVVAHGVDVVRVFQREVDLLGAVRLVFVPGFLGEVLACDHLIPCSISWLPVCVTKKSK